MFIINSVEIEGFWNKFNVKTDFYDDVNIFIGVNGTGKTTFINILQALLTVDLNLLQSMRFTKVRLALKSQKKRRIITVTRSSEEMTFDKIKYKIGRNTFEFPLMPRDMEYRPRRIHPRYIEIISDVRKALAKIVNVSWLSVTREIIANEIAERHYQRQVAEKNPIDSRLDELMKRLTRYQLQLESEANTLAKEFQKQVSASMLYNSRFDTWALDSYSPIDLKQAKRGLIQAYKDLGVLDTKMSKKIEEHMAKIAKSLKNIDSSIKSDGPIMADDVLPLSLLRRTRYIAKLSTRMENRKKEVYAPIDTFLGMLTDFTTGLQFRLDPGGSEELQPYKGKEELSLEQLSSGEKQLLILLTETLLQRNTTSIFIADEPELSLHISWQRKILSAIRKLNSQAQIVVATHSPEIAGRWKDNIIGMEDIVHE